MQNKFIRRGLALIMGFCLALPMLAVAPVAAQEDKPFLTVKVAGPESLLKISKKIAELSGNAETFAQMAPMLGDLSGFNAKAPIGLVVRSDGKEIKDVFLALPIEDIDEVTNMFFVMFLRGSITETEEENVYLFNNPMGPAFRLEQKKGYLLATPEASKAKLPDDPGKYFAGMEKYSLAVKVDFENVGFESIEQYLAMFQMMMAMQGGPEAAEGLDAMLEQVELAHKEFRSALFGVTFDPESSDIEIDSAAYPRKGSDSEKQLAASLDAKTAFAGFRGGKNTIFYLGGCDFVTKEQAEMTMKSFDTMLDGFLEQAEMQSETDEEFEFTESVAESVRTVLKSILKEGSFDYACSMDAEGTVLGAMSVGDTKALGELAEKVVTQVKKFHEDADIDKFMDAHLKKAYDTVEGFKISKLIVPLSEISAEAHEVPESLADLTISVFWGVKEGQAIAFAAGLDEAKTEKAFKDALAGTKSKVDIVQPQAAFALKPLGTFLKKLKIDEENEEAKIGVNILAGADDDAVITVTGRPTEGGIMASIKMSGKVLTTLIKAFQDSSASSAGDRTIRNF